MVGRGQSCRMDFCDNPIGHNRQDLCSEHLAAYRHGRIDRCPRCFKLKESRYHSCYNCRDLVEEDPRRWSRSDRGITEFYVYILRLDDGTLYFGQTNNLRRRLAQHQAGETPSTSGKNPVLAWYNTVPTREQATALELHLKNTDYRRIYQMCQNFDAAINGMLPNFVTQGNLTELKQEVGKAQLNVQKAVNGQVMLA